MHGGCQPKMPVRVDDRPGSGCRRDCLHRVLVGDYRAVKAGHDADRLARRELETNGYAAEGAAFDELNQAFTFKQYLMNNRSKETA